MSAVAALAFGVACGGGSAGQPTPSASPTVAILPTPARPALASPVPSPSPAAASPASAGQTYVVQAGDTLLSIAEKFYGDGTKWRTIYDANKAVIGNDPDSLKIDTKLTIPPKS